MSTLPLADGVSTRILGGTAQFRRTNLALFLAGFSIFALLYGVQPLMPVFAQEFHVSPATSSLTISLTTGALAVMMLFAGALSDAIGRKRIMCLSMTLSALLTLGAAFVGDFTQLMVLRLLMGVALSGVPSIAMAYLGEEIDPRSVGLAMGLFIGGSGFGGMVGRVVTGALTDYASWRVALLVLGGAGLVAAVAFWRSLPESRHFIPRSFHPWRLVTGLGEPFAIKGLPWLFAAAFLLMGSFVTLYNYVGFRLMAPPFNLSQTVTGSLFTVYLVGIWASAWIGGLADRYGRRRMLWIAVLILLAGVELTRSHSLAVIVLGIATVTFGFFGGHSIASSWISRRAMTSKAQASSLYLFFYYTGSALVGSYGGVVWSQGGWTGVANLLTLLQVAALLVALRLSFLKPLSVAP
ncbi:MFS transporter [Aliidongia dinghuensis]|uniref:MFS transporter n=1 Tax=Aliidongia dinghuensis TaxID=1867774 RepID=A0A8J3E5P0_9PROT|nr:MFS transporter [Aliidongia dinghuensis]GGF34120.1 MFS transporter [Aliidongia dinghuensis]